MTDFIASRIDTVVAAIDRRVGAQLDAILHHAAFQRLERSWRGLAFVVERTRFEENIRVEILDCSIADLAADLARGERATASGLYATLYTRAFGRHGGEPYGAVIVDHAFEPADVPLLERCASLAYMAMAPFIAGASPRLLGLDAWTELASGAALTVDPALAALGEREEARTLGLALPRFLLRAPFALESGLEAPALVYREGTPDDEAHCWGNACYALATRLTESFALYRWCPNIINEDAGGLVADLPVRAHAVLGAATATEVALTHEREYELAELRLIPLVAREGLHGACFYSACSLQRPKRFGDSEEGRAAEMNARLGTELPYLFILTRCLHYISAAYYTREDPTAPRADVERDLNDWIGQFVANREVITAERRKPLRKASIVVTETAHGDDWYKLDLKLRPHFKHLGAFFTLSLAGKLDR